MQQSTNNKIALAHDFLVTWGGAERVFQALAERYPEAPIYTLFYDSRFTDRHFPGREIRASFLQKFPHWLRTTWVGYLFYPVAVETLDLRNFDTVLSSSGAWMKGLVTRLHTRHIAYLHSPMRYVWDTFHSHPQLRSGFRFFKRLLMSYFRLWDKAAADRPDVLLANSQYTAERVQKYYRREATVLYPPIVVTEPLSGSYQRSHFLVVGRLTRTKHIDLIIEAFNKLNLPLVVVGGGAERKHLRETAGPNIVFTGSVSDERLHELYAQARALIQASEEDFGLAVVEALVQGTPVIAYRAGAITEILTSEMGVLFDDLIPESIADGVRRFIEHERSFSLGAMRSVSQRFSRENFDRGIEMCLTRVGD